MAQFAITHNDIIVKFMFWAWKVVVNQILIVQFEINHNDIIVKFQF